MPIEAFSLFQVRRYGPPFLTIFSQSLNLVRCLIWHQGLRLLTGNSLFSQLEGMDPPFWRGICLIQLWGNLIDQAQLRVF